MNKETEIEQCFLDYTRITQKKPSDLSKADRYSFADMLLREEFQKKDTSISHIYKKVVLLNALYSTNVMATFDMTLHISRIKDFERRVQEGDISLVDDIRYITIEGKDKNFYSFATKYCHHHNVHAYPIFDSFVVFYLKKYNKEINLLSREQLDNLKDYSVFKNCIDTLAESWEIPDEYKYYKLDKYLWIEGKRVKTSLQEQHQ